MDEPTGLFGLESLCTRYPHSIPSTFQESKLQSFNPDTDKNNCMLWFDGCNDCRRYTVGGTLDCGKIKPENVMACLGGPIRTPYCKDWEGY